MNTIDLNLAAGWAGTVQDALFSTPSKRILACSIAFLASYAIPRLIDKTGSTIKRPMLKRFFTIVLPENMPIATLVVLSRLPNLAALSNPGVCLFSLCAIAGTSILFDQCRYGIGWIGSKINVKKPELIEEAMQFIGPRDFYATHMETVGTIR